MGRSVGQFAHGVNKRSPQVQSGEGNAQGSGSSQVQSGVGNVNQRGGLNINIQVGNRNRVGGGGGGGTGGGGGGTGGGGGGGGSKPKGAKEKKEKEPKGGRGSIPVPVPKIGDGAKPTNHAESVITDRWGLHGARARFEIENVGDGGGKSSGGGGGKRTKDPNETEPDKTKPNGPGPKEIGPGPRPKEIGPGGGRPGPNGTGPGGKGPGGDDSDSPPRMRATLERMSEGGDAKKAIGGGPKKAIGPGGRASTDLDDFREHEAGAPREIGGGAKKAIGGGAKAIESGPRAIGAGSSSHHDLHEKTKLHPTKDPNQFTVAHDDERNGLKGRGVEVGHTVSHRGNTYKVLSITRGRVRLERSGGGAPPARGGGRKKRQQQEKSEEPSAEKAVGGQPKAIGGSAPADEKVHEGRVIPPEPPPSSSSESSEEPESPKVIEGELHRDRTGRAGGRGEKSPNQRLKEARTPKLEQPPAAEEAEEYTNPRGTRVKNMASSARRRFSKLGEGAREAGAEAKDRWAHRADQVELDWDMRARDMRREAGGDVKPASVAAAHVVKNAAKVVRDRMRSSEFGSVDNPSMQRLHRMRDGRPPLAIEARPEDTHEDLSKLWSEPPRAEPPSRPGPAYRESGRPMRENRTQPRFSPNRAKKKSIRGEVVND